MTAIDRQQIIEDAAKAIFDVRDDEFDLDEWEDIDSTEHERYQCAARAALPVIVAAVLKPIRELHVSGELVCVETGHVPSRCPCSEVFCEGCGESMPCPTVRLLDEIESSAKGGE